MISLSPAAGLSAAMGTWPTSGMPVLRAQSDPGAFGFLDGLGKLFYMMGAGLARILDVLAKAVFVLGGLETSSVATDPSGHPVGSDLTQYFIQSSWVSVVFWGIFLIGVFLLGVFAIIAMARATIKMNPNATWKTVMVFSGKGMFAMLAVPFFFTAGLFLTTTVMKSFNAAMGVAGSPSIGETFVEVAWLPSWTDNGWDNAAEIKDGIARYLSGHPEFDYSNVDQVKELIDSSVHGNWYFWYFQNIVTIVGALVMIVTLGMATFQFVERMFNIIILYITSPVIASTYPLDDGQRFRKYTQVCATQFIGAFGIIIAMDVYMAVVPAVNALDWTISMPGNPSMAVFLNFMMPIIIAIGGAFALSGATKLISEFTGGGAQGSTAHAVKAAGAGLAGFAAGAALTGRGVGRGMRLGLAGLHDAGSTIMRGKGHGGHAAALMGKYRRKDQARADGSTRLGRLKSALTGKWGKDPGGMSGAGGKPVGPKGGGPDANGGDEGLAAAVGAGAAAGAALAIGNGGESSPTQDWEADEAKAKAEYENASAKAEAAKSAGDKKTADQYSGVAKRARRRLNKAQARQERYWKRERKRNSRHSGRLDEAKSWYGRLARNTVSLSRHSGDYLRRAYRGIGNFNHDLAEGGLRAAGSSMARNFYNVNHGNIGADGKLTDPYSGKDSAVSWSDRTFAARQAHRDHAAEADRDEERRSAVASRRSNGKGGKQ